ncbi:MAG: CCA tRNA nucleotidyltransferase [Rhodospirillaceae bacterium]|jgi:poly(A) polymerase|nr:CCA tRNA nucleotidyltransferase [Rhodospirillaceae bacterium]MBT4488371.1 CCA tRNA nucleotidyltransferase [Rhodospirillaceae bacterium]MBT5191748.1 CCA tRNA nucleotidyltransferase [Rhodospirillaceae bacterium]MBT5896034.1 CCA tRNA nucleotidyltransferase [Rhodospirillaceae bacterium]MBT7757696.1 CCA tRNA nucleotidyltransferase [Rhodospirillaceae bacterium]
MAMRPLSRQTWLTAQSSQAVLAALAGSGATPRFVGGCVRDGLLGQTSADLDIAVDQLPGDSMALLQAADIKVIPTGLKHGTITAVINGQHFEITALRVDVETFGRHATVAFTDDWQRDADRRDFTINAIYADGDGQVFDPTDGMADLAAGRVRFVGTAAQRINEDKLRILRFFRFQARFGQGAPDAEALAACTSAAPGIAGLSGERVRDELFKILALPTPRPSLELMAGAGVLQQILPQGHDLSQLDRCDDDPLRRLSAIARGESETIAQGLRLSNRQAERLAFLMTPPSGFSAALTRPALRQLLYDHGPDAIADLTRQQGAHDLLPRIAEATPPAFALTGRDAIALGMRPGPEVGKILRRLEQTWRDTDFAADREQLLASLKNTLI